MISKTLTLNRDPIAEKERLGKQVTSCELESFLGIARVDCWEDAFVVPQTIGDANFSRPRPMEIERKSLKRGLVV